MRRERWSPVLISHPEQETSVRAARGRDDGEIGFCGNAKVEVEVEVPKLASELRFEEVEAGALRNARFLEPIGKMNIHFGFLLGRSPTTAPA
jgi:predicted dinucleotide-binding enzyme